MLPLVQRSTTSKAMVPIFLSNARLLISSVLLAKARPMRELRVQVSPARCCRLKGFKAVGQGWSCEMRMAKRLGAILGLSKIAILPTIHTQPTVWRPCARESHIYENKSRFLGWMRWRCYQTNRSTPQKSVPSLTCLIVRSDWWVTMFYLFVSCQLKDLSTSFETASLKMPVQIWWIVSRHRISKKIYSESI